MWVRVLTFCVMSKYDPILLEVPKRPDILPTAEQVMELLRAGSDLRMAELRLFP